MLCHKRDAHREYAVARRLFFLTVSDFYLFLIFNNCENAPNFERAILIALFT